MLQASIWQSPKQIFNDKALSIYAAFILGIILVSTLSHIIHRLVVKHRKSWIFQHLQLPHSRLPRYFMNHELSSVFIVALYLSTNVVLCFTPAVSYRVNYWASRFGWLAATNMALCVFLSLKNTILRFILPTSYHRLNFLHQIVGYTAIAQTVLHGVAYTIHFGSQDRWAKLIQSGGNRQGLFAGAGVLILAMGALSPVRYTRFYASHLLGFVVIIVSLAHHRPGRDGKLTGLVVLMLGMWVLDRISRGVRMALNAINNKVSLYPLAGGGIRAVFRKPLSGAFPGMHCFVWIPGIRCNKTYPFTIVSNSKSGLELVIKSYDGFTKEAYELSLATPGRTMRASIHGPYGNLPEFQSYDKLILISGGSGASFTFGLMKFLLESKHESKMPITFIWAVRTQEDISWYKPELLNLTTGFNNISIIIQVTRQPSLSPLQESDCSASRAQSQSKDSPIIETTPLLGTSPNQDHWAQNTADGEWKMIEDRIDLRVGKLRASQVIWESVQFTDDQERVLVASCGPESLTKTLQKSVQECQTSSGVVIDLFTEHYGW